MNVSLTPELESIVDGKVKSGLYSSASEVVRAALRLLEKQDAEYEAKLKALRADIQEGIDDLEAGRFRNGREAMADIHAMLIEKTGSNG